MAMPFRCPPVVRVPAIRNADEGEPLQPPNPVRPHSDKATGNAGGGVQVALQRESHSTIDDETLAAASLSHLEETGKRSQHPPASTFQISRSPILGIAS
jgi:hypothetical protein